MDRHSTNKPHRRHDLDLLKPWQHKLHEVIFEADTRAGRLFDVALFALIALSIVAVMAESVVESPSLIRWIWGAEVLLTVLFTLEYVLRILSVGRPWHYVFSFFGIIDLLAILPTYITCILGFMEPDPGLTASSLGSLTVVRSFRLLRVFRVLKLAQYLSEANLMLLSVKKTAAKITVFFMFVMVICLILGTAMYVIEGRRNPDDFGDIPHSVYWAIVTVTTVGYGDLAPETWLGRTVAAMTMIIGYSIIVVPTGIVTAEIMAAQSGASSSIGTRACHECSRDGHDVDADYCKYCGMEL